VDEAQGRKGKKGERKVAEQIAPGAASVTLEELGTNCWHPCRFIKNDGRCARVYTCSYPEKKKCEAVHAEILYLEQQQLRLLGSVMTIGHTIEGLRKMLE
jgi:hypothetical protein